MLSQAQPCCLALPKRNTFGGLAVVCGHGAHSIIYEGMHWQTLRVSVRFLSGVAPMREAAAMCALARGGCLRVCSELGSWSFKV